MHDPSFMALALIVSEKMTYTQKSLRRRRRRRRRQRRRRKSNIYVSLLLRRRDKKKTRLYTRNVLEQSCINFNQWFLRYHHFRVYAILVTAPGSHLDRYIHVCLLLTTLRWFDVSFRIWYQNRIFQNVYKLLHYYIFIHHI